MRQNYPVRIETESILETLARTLLYEGYALFPYHRSAVKNLKPIPVGIVYPRDYQVCCPEAAAVMQAECIVTGPVDMALDINARFLHLQEQRLFKCAEPTSDKPEGNVLEPVDFLEIGTYSYSTGWDALERNIVSGKILLSQVLESEIVCSIEFSGSAESENLFTENDVLAGKQIRILRGIHGSVEISALPVPEMNDCFKIKVKIRNNSRVENAFTASRDDIYPQSFMSAHIVLSTDRGEFISAQGPGAIWEPIAAQCHNINTYPILIDESNTTMLASPIILYDYPQIDQRSTGDLFDCSEIEEALLLHIAVLSDEEKQRISQSDEKLRAMLKRVEMVTPEEIVKLHGGMKALRDEG